MVAKPTNEGGARKRSTKQASKDSARQPTKQAAKRSANQPAKRSANQPAKRSANQPAKRSAKQAAMQSATGEIRPVPFEALNDVAPGLMRSQDAWLSQIDSLGAPDRKTHELIRMVCSVVARNPQGIRHHARLAAEVGASWEEVAGSVILVEPAFGILVVAEAFPWARRGWERGSLFVDEDES